MTPTEKIYHYTRLGLIEEYGEEFLDLDKSSQNELIIQAVQDYIDCIKRGGTL